MIKIKLDPKQILQITNTYKSYVVAPLKAKITEQIGKGGSRAEQIARDFLKRHFWKNGDVDENLIIHYLLRDDPEEIILSFWNCVSSVWCREFLIPEQDDFAQRLSKWNGAKHETLDNLERNKTNPTAPAERIIGTDTEIFFARFPRNASKVKPLTNDDLTIISRLEKVTFDLYEDLGKVYAPGSAERGMTYGALDMLEEIFKYT